MNDYLVILLLVVGSGTAGWLIRGWWHLPVPTDRPADHLEALRRVGEHPAPLGTPSHALWDRAGR